MTSPVAIKYTTVTSGDKLLQVKLNVYCQKQTRRACRCTNRQPRHAKNRGVGTDIQWTASPLSDTPLLPEIAALHPLYEAL